MRKNTVWSSQYYRSFVSDRDRALERIHQNTQMDISRIMQASFEQIQSFILSLTVNDQLNIYQLGHLSADVERTIGIYFDQVFPLLVARVKKMRRAIFTLTYTSELEALSRATGKKKNLISDRYEKNLLKAFSSSTILGESLEKRIWVDLVKLRYKLMNAFNLSIVQELKPRELLQKLQQVLPQIQTYRRPPRELKPIRESDQKKKDQEEIYSFDFISDQDWDMTVDSILSTDLPSSRFQNEKNFDPEAGYFKYNWELEQELTDDFVKQVRDGQVEAAKELGIQEFVWVAIIDDKTDDCCLKRNGHTTSEIGELLQSGKLDAEKCDAVTPPAHPNCRCQLGPVASTEEVEGADWKSFEDWLKA